ncbi:hypothetical protein C2E31_06980 [Rhodopirellula baltica]|nr:hypothetical protein C2E31_06980 [Rhodopirellula baltica]
MPEMTSVEKSAESTMPKTASSNLSIEDVIRSERKEIAERREKANLPKIDRHNGVVGLALSGGGLRSACFSVGVTQALHACGLWKLIDYMSSVSGGGYTAGYISNQLTRSQECDGKDAFPFSTEPPVNDQPTAAGPQSTHVRRLIQSGNYLFRPIFFINRYLFGLLLINVAFFSLVVACSSLIAFLWRCLDYDVVRRNADLLNLSDDLLVPFFPAVLFGCCWLAAWGISLWRRNDISTGGTARFFLYLLLPSVLIGLALVAGNGDNEGTGVELLTGQPIFVLPNSVWATITGAVGAALLPWIRPQRILQSGINPQSPLERYVFLLASTGLLIGIPLLLVGFIAKENISGFNTHPYREMVGGDIRDESIVASLAIPSTPTPDKPNTIPELFAKTVRDNFDEEDDVNLDLGLLVKNARSGNVDEAFKNYLLGADTTQNRQRLDQIRDAMLYQSRYPIDQSLAIGNDASPLVVADVLAAIASLDLEYLRSVRQRSSNVSFSHLATDPAGQIGPRTEDRAMVRRALNRSLLCSALASQLLRPEVLALREALKDDKRFHHTRITPNLHSWYLNLGHWGNLRSQNETSDYIAATQLSRHIRNNLATSFELNFFDDPDVRSELAGLVRDVQNSIPMGVEPLILPPDLQEHLNQIAIASDVPLTPDVGRRISRLAFQTMQPDALRPRTEIRRTITHSNDQVKRLTIFTYAALVFLMAGALVNLNTVSLHRYYRNRIAQAFVSGSDGSESSIPLSKLNTCNVGGPYHLICGSISLLHSNLFPKVFAASDPAQKLPAELLRSQDSFLLSKNYCGSELTGFMDTDKYESMIPGSLNKIDLADSIAISGAAVSPGNVTNPLIATLMLILNLRLGQWLPNPQRTPTTFPNVISSLIDTARHWKKRQYFFVSDGGVRENLGLVQLLKRQCRLIICVDASYDPKRQFADLARAIAEVRVHQGIRLVEIAANHDQPSSGFAVDEFLHGDDKDNHQRPICKSHFKVGRILYGDGSHGTLILIKPSFTGDESLDLQYYRGRFKDFPHESTSDQFYDASQVEAYRRLGEHIGKRVGRAIADSIEKMELQETPGESANVELICEALEQYQLAQSNPTSDTETSDTAPTSALTKKLERLIKRKRNWESDACVARHWNSISESLSEHGDATCLTALSRLAFGDGVEDQISRRAKQLLHWKTSQTSGV